MTRDEMAVSILTTLIASDPKAAHKKRVLVAEAFEWADTVLLNPTRDAESTVGGPRPVRPCINGFRYHQWDGDSGVCARCHARSSATKVRADHAYQARLREGAKSCDVNTSN